MKSLLIFFMVLISSVSYTQENKDTTILRLKRELIESEKTVRQCYNSYELIFQATHQTLVKLDKLTSDMETYLPKNYIIGASVNWYIDGGAMFTIPVYINRHLYIQPGYTSHNRWVLGVGHQMNARTSGSIYVSDKFNDSNITVGMLYNQHVYKGLALVAGIETKYGILLGIQYNVKFK